MNIVDRAKQALWKKSSLPHDGQGYLQDPELNLVAGVQAEMIRKDFEGGSGQEWTYKIKAIHSSAALAANTFGRWKTDPALLTFDGISGFFPPRLEAQCPTGLRGTPPNLDVLLESDNTIFGNESKLLEPLIPTQPKFAASYKKERLPLCEDTWWSLLEQVRQWPPSHLDAAQLIKHYFGLRNKYPAGKQVWLVYLYWKPLNADGIEEYTRHTEDLMKFQKMIGSTGAVRFKAMDYIQLWDQWEKDSNMAEHTKLLKNRYCVEI